MIARLLDEPLTSRHEAGTTGSWTFPVTGAWSRRKLDAGESEALIAHLDATSMFLLPEDLGSVSDAAFEELLEHLRSEVH